MSHTVCDIILWGRDILSRDRASCHKWATPGETVVVGSWGGRGGGGGSGTVREGTYTVLPDGKGVLVQQTGH